ncbi:MAG: hypothetical protein Q9181_006614 [Wetmoreana brouardii]
MQTAFNILHIPSCHSFSLYSHILDIPLWLRAFDAKYRGKGGPPFARPQWDQLLAEYGAVTDVPALAFWQDLVAAYPEAKVVLMQRDDVEAWYRSFDDAIIKLMWGRVGNFIADLDPWFVGPLRDVHLRWARDWMRVSSAEEMRKVARSRYREHYEDVRSVVPRERLLEYRLGSGWEPLCAFLGKEVPADVAFPRVNETKSMQEKVAIIMRRGVRNFLKAALLWLFPVLLSLVLLNVFYY